MTTIELINSQKCKKNFSFEVLPPLKGNGTGSLFNTIDKLKEFKPLFINITNHSSEYVYKEHHDGLLERTRIHRRPGTVAIAAAIQYKYNIPVMPHIICAGASRSDIEYELLDLQFLGIENLLVLRGDKAHEDKKFTPAPNGYSHATELIEQINQFNKGFFIDGSPIKNPGKPFDFGVACYPEKHEEAPNMEAVTQLFYDNEKYYAFVEECRRQGVNIPIIPAIKPFAKLSQLTVVPKTFHCDFPKELADEAMKCKTDEDAKQLGIEWTTQQVKDLYAHGINNVHFFTVSAVDSVVEVMKNIL